MIGLAGVVVVERHLRPWRLPAARGRRLPVKGRRGRSALNRPRPAPIWFNSGRWRPAAPRPGPRRAPRHRPSRRAAGFGWRPGPGRSKLAGLGFRMDVDLVGPRIVVPPLLAAHRHEQALHPAMVGRGHDLPGVIGGSAGARQLPVAGRGLLLLLAESAAPPGPRPAGADHRGSPLQGCR